MSGMPSRPPGKSIGFFRLLDACERPGCPVCRCLVDEARRYLDSLLYEQVTDPETRRRLRASWGFCNWHAWLLREVSDAAFGSAILSEDLLRVATERFARGASQTLKTPRGLLGRLRELGRPSRRSALAALYRGRAACPGCRLLGESEQHYLAAALRFVDDPQFDRAYRQSHGLCLPHAVGAVDLGAGSAQARRLVALTLPKWAELRRDLQGFIDKHDHLKRRPFTEAESLASLRALEVVAGAPGLFGCDLRAGGRDTGEGDEAGREP
jgi:hypothetical protein